MRLLTLFPSQDRGGAEEYALKVAIAAKEEGWKVGAAFPQCPGTETLADDFRRLGIEVHPLDVREPVPRIEGGFQRRIRYGKHALRTVRILRTFSPSVVHLSLPWPTHGLGAMVACATLRVPVGVVFQLVADGNPVPVWDRVVYALRRRRSQRWVTVSEVNRNLLLRKFGMLKASFQVIRNAAPLTPVDFSEDDQEVRRAVREELGIPVDSRILLTVGRLASEKGHDLLIPGIGRVVHRHPTVKFVWVGEGENRAALKDALIEEGVDESVLFTGFRSDVRRLLAAADLFVFPTRFEGFPFSLLEAMAAGLQVVASDASSIPELVENGTHGLLFSSESPSSLEDSLLRALENPGDMKEMASVARARAEDYSEERMLKETLSFLRTTSLSRIDGSSTQEPSG